MKRPSPRRAERGTRVEPRHVREATEETVGQNPEALDLDLWTIESRKTPGRLGAPGAKYWGCPDLAQSPSCWFHCGDGGSDVVWALPCC